MSNPADSPLYLNWSRQGKVWWNDDWIETHGPVRDTIPGLDEHVSFANYDLKLNGLPLISRSDTGRLFVMCLKPMTLDAIALFAAQLRPILIYPGRIEQYIKTNVYDRLAKVASILDVVLYHGFEPAERTRGLDYLDSIAPRKGLRRVEYRRLNP